MKLFWFLVWVTFAVYSIAAAPGHWLGSDPLLLELLALKTKEPLLLMMFLLKGVFLLIYACLLLRDDRGSWPAWPFILFSFALGAFALLPYFFLSLPGRRVFHRSPRVVRRMAESGIVHAALLLLTAASVYHGLANGSPDVYMDAFRTSRFVQIVSVEFIVLTLLSVYAIHSQQRGYGRSSAAWLGLVPLAGPLLYLMFTRAPR